MGRPLRILLADDQWVILAGLRLLLKHRPAMTVVGEAATVEAAVAETARAAPDVVIMDVRLADGSGVEATREILSAHPAARVLLLTSCADEDAAEAAVMAGASGYLLKQTRGADLVDAIEAVATGQSLLDPTATARLLARFKRLARNGHDDGVAPLTDQERRVLAQIAKGKTNREIAATLHLSEKIIKNFVSTLLDKLRVKRRAAAAGMTVTRRLA